MSCELSAEALTPFSAAHGQHLASPYRSKAGAETMTAFANQFTRLVGAFHGTLLFTVKVAFFSTWGGHV